MLAVNETGGQNSNQLAKRYVLPALAKRVSRLFIGAGDVVQNWELAGSVLPAVCSALKTRQVCDRDNHLRFSEATGPKSGPEHDRERTLMSSMSARVGQETKTHGRQLRGALKEFSRNCDGGEAYLPRKLHRSNFAHGA